MRKKLSTSLVLASVLLTGCINTDVGKVDRDVINIDTELPQFGGTSSLTIDENKVDVGVIDFEYDGKLTYEISDGADSALFLIDSESGALSFKNAPDFENPTDSNYDNIYEIVLKVTDTNSNSITQNITVKVENVADTKPQLKATEASVSQNSLTDVTVAKVEIVSSGDSSITSMTLTGEGSDLFEILKDGTVTLKKALTKTAGSTYDLTVSATNEAGSTTAALKINVTEPDLTPPTFTTANSVTVNENEVDVLDIEATDSGFVTYSLLDSEDSDKFSINAQSGQLSFKTPVDFENPLDSDANNIYKVRVSAKDSVLNEATQDITVTVNNIFDVKPAIEPLTITISEGVKVDSQIGNIIINNSGDSAIKSITLGGEGSENFSVDTQGAITLKNQLSFAQKPLYTLTAVASNSAGNSDPVSLIINVTEVTDTLPSTGQITSKVDFDDGYYKRGIPKSFTDNNETDIVTDNLTSLQWQDINYELGLNKDINYTEAVAYCNNLEQAGFNDWRVPTSDEYVYIADRGIERILDESFGFIDDYLTHYWTSTDSNVAGYKWTIELEYGESKTDAITNNQGMSVRCVRGTYSLNSNYVRDDQNSIVTDEATNLIWQDDLEARTKNLTFQEAIDYCENLTLADKTEWRLPNFNELYSIVDKSKNNPAIKDGFVNVNTTDYYWSSTSDVYNPNDLFIWLINFNNGVDDRQYAGAVSKHYTRCVHSVK